MQENEIQVTFEELKDYAKNMIKMQMAQYGQLDPKEEERKGEDGRREKLCRLPIQLCFMSNFLNVCLA